MRRPDYREIAGLLADRIEQLAVELFPAGIREGSELKVGSLGGEAGRSLCICMRGPKAGIFCDFAGGPSGDALDLVAHALYRGDRRQALIWSIRWLDLETGAAVAGPSRRARRQAEEPAQKPESNEAARRLWMEARPAAGSIVETYLETRSLLLPQVECIRFHPSCPHGSGVRYSAMLALMTDPATNLPVGIHRTPILPDGAGRPEGVDKKMLGRAGVIRLSDDADVTGALGLAEGIETALSVMQHGKWCPVWAACTAGGVERFPVLPGIECLTFFADHDIAGRNAAQACARRWLSGGRETRILTPRQNGDWNDVIREAAA
jgi:hypothetical protein